MTATLNAILWDYGVGPSGVGDNATFVAEVCNKPAVSQQRRLALTGFKWPGYGACRYCKMDNFDARRRLQYNDPNWFTNIYAPELKNTLRNAISQKLVPKAYWCLGKGPRVLVDVIPAGSYFPLVC